MASKPVLRFMEAVIRRELKSHPAVCLVGPRQSGKTTLVKKFREHGYVYFSLNDEQHLEMVDKDLKGLLLSHPKIIIDEHQRRDLSQGLISAIDERREQLDELANGMVILTGSFTRRGFDSLAGRVAELKLLPLAQAELKECKAPDFLKQIFEAQCPQSDATGLIEKNFIDELISGGYPLLQKKKSQQARGAWLRYYLSTIRELDIPSLQQFRVSFPDKDLLAILADYVGGEINKARTAQKLNVGVDKLGRILDVFEDMHLIKRLRKHGKLRKGNKKLFFVDTGIYTQVAKLTKESIVLNRGHLGPLLETFVYGELAKYCDWASDGHELSYYKQDQPSDAEVDFVIEDNSGRIVGIEVKAAVEFKSKYFHGLREMKKKYGAKMIMGLVITLGNNMLLDKDNNFHAINVSALWHDYDYEKIYNPSLFD